MEAAPAPETVDPLPVKRPSTAAAGGEPRPATEPREASEVVPDSLCLLTAPVDPEAGEPGRAGTVADSPPAVVVTTGLDDGVVTETVATGVVALTVVVGTDGALGTVVDTAGTVVDTVGTVVDTVDTTVDTVDTTVDTGGTVVGTVVGTVGTVTVALSGRADASTFATKKPDTAKQTSTTSVLHLTTFISPSAECPCTQQELLAPPANLITRELEAR